ncbi:hypothetical protein F5Y13DRAFT_183771 [Hypoxylon sp. FL1857]|nr:hypothetical protein F5Y13DRAFT_183771 [Hypoxylon sp. FL1857]
MGGDFDWLAAAERSLRQDLETSKKELDLVRGALDELESSSAREVKGGRSKYQMFLMRACQEYSGSRNHMLEERLRQVHFWSSNKQAGEGIPEKVPDEWFVVDNEWRRWLSEQAAVQSNETSRLNFGKFYDEGVDAIVGHWGPLILILTAYTEQNGAYSR